MNARKAKALRKVAALMVEAGKCKPTSYAQAIDRGTMLVAKGERMAYKMMKKILSGVK